MNEIVNLCVWRQRREDTMREVDRDRLAKFLRVEREKRTVRTFSLAWEMRRMAGLLLKFLRKLESRKGGRP